MTVADLIVELQRHPPQKQVRVLMGTVIVEDEAGGHVLSFPRHCAREVDDVRNEGAYVLIESR